MVIRAPRAQRTFFGQSCSFGWSSRFHVVHSTKEFKRYSEYFFPLMILNTALNIFKKLALITVDVFVRSYKPNSHLPWRKVWIVYEGSLPTDLSPDRENTIFQMYIYIDDLLSNVFDYFLPLFWPRQAISSARHLHVSPRFHSCSFVDAIQNVLNQMWWNILIE